MNPSEFQSRLADYLAGELGDADRAAMDTHLATSPVDRAEVESLRRAAARIQSGLVPLAEADRCAAERSLPRIDERGRKGRPPSVWRRSGWLLRGLRYAAIIGVAFVGGMWAESLRSGGRSTEHHPRPPQFTESSDAMDPLGTPAFVSAGLLRAAARTAEEHPGIDPLLAATLSLGKR